MHPDAESALRSWSKIVRQAEWQSFTDVRCSINFADAVGHLVVFNSGGNKYRLIVHIRYDKGRIYVRSLLTHEEYDADGWKRDPWL